MRKNPLPLSPLGAALRAERRTAGLAQADIAGRVGCSLPTVIKAERGGGRFDRFEDMVVRGLGLEISGRSLPSGAHIGERLALLRERREISRRTLTETAQVSAPTIAAIETGKTGHLSAVERLALALGAGLFLAPPGQGGYWRTAAISSAHQGWHTPPEILEKLYPIVNGRFCLDPCSPAKGKRAPVRARIHFTVEDDGLSLPWLGAAFVNPPYNRELRQWVRKARIEAAAGRASPVIGLIPARPDTTWWHADVAGHADVFMLRGRLRFGGKDGGAAPFPSALALWGGNQEHRDGLRAAFPDAWYIPAS